MNSASRRQLDAIVIPDGGFKTIIAAPPWPYTGRGPASSKEHRPNSYGAAPSSAERYGSMSMAELKGLPVAEVAQKQGHLYLWTTNGFLCEAHDLARAWGFVPKTVLTWGKLKADGTPSMKTGYYYRGATEHILFATRGNLRLQGEARPTLYLSRRLPHSVKPDWFYDLVESASPGPYLELFARRNRDNFTVWGNEV